MVVPDLVYTTIVVVIRVLLCYLPHRTGVQLKAVFGCRAGRYEVDGYVYNAAEEPQILMTGKWNESMSYQPCDMEGEPLPGTELKEVTHRIFLL